MTNEKMREEFEKWVKHHQHYIPLSTTCNLPRFKMGDYTDSAVQIMWIAWQASRENIEVELPLERLNPVYDMGFNEGRQACLEKLTEQGVKVK